MIDLLGLVEIPELKELEDLDQLSGGMRQRVMISIASCTLN